MYPVNPRKGIKAYISRKRSPSIFKLYNEGIDTKVKNDDDVSENKIKLVEVVKQNFRDYCSSSTIHGLKYIGQRKRIERQENWENSNYVTYRNICRFLWILICIFLLCGCGTQIYEIVGKWRKTPLVFLLDTKDSPIQEIDFPAVTICPQRMPNRNRFNYTDFLQRFLNSDDFDYTDEEMKLFGVVTKICYRQVLKHLQKLEPFFDKAPNYTNSELIDIMEEYFLPSPLKLFHCMGIMPNVNFWECDLRFTRIWLKEGLCYSFNLLPKDQIFREEIEYPLADTPNLVLPEEEPERSNAEEDFDYLEDDNSPYRVFTRRERLHVRTRAYDDFTDPTCKPDFYVFIHNPYEIPWDSQSFGYLLDTDVYVKNVLTVTPFVIRTDQNLQTLFTPEERGCYFEDERPLRLFLKYSQNNCELECMVNASFDGDHFNCSAFWMPRTSDMPLCNLNMYMIWYAIEYMAVDDLLECDCLPDCNSVDYKVTISSSHTPYFDDTAITKEDAMKYEEDDLADAWLAVLQQKLLLAKEKNFKFEIPLDEALEQSNITMDFDIWKWKFSEIEVHYENSEFLAMKRHLAYSFADFISQIGGILGCFLGISIFSIIEIIYFCTVKMVKAVKQNKKEKKQPRILVRGMEAKISRSGNY